jgi:hypothetical protein
MMAHTPARIRDSRRFQEPVAYRIPPDDRMSRLVFQPFQYRLVSRLVYLALQLPSGLALGSTSSRRTEVPGT